MEILKLQFETVEKAEAVENLLNKCNMVRLGSAIVVLKTMRNCDEIISAMVDYDGHTCEVSNQDEHGLIDSIGVGFWF